MSANTFCVMPFTTIDMQPDGKYRLCCVADGGNGFIYDQNNQPFKIGDKPFDQIWNSEYYRDIRRKMLNGQRPSPCEVCYRTEEQGKQSDRIMYGKKRTAKTYNEVVPVEDLVRLHLKFSNLCNLKCRMCTPQRSILIAKEWNEIWTGINSNIKLLTEEQKAEYNGQSWYHGNAKEQINDMAPNLKHVYISGGEPSLSHECTEFLTMLANKGYAKDIDLTYVFNLTNVHPNNITLLSKFKSVCLLISVEAYGELNRYIRYPSNWHGFETNFKRLKDLLYKNKWKHITPYLNTTVQIYNIFNIPMIADWSQVMLKREVNLCTVYEPYFLSVQALPKELKQMAADTLLSIDHSQVKSFVEFMYAEDRSEHFPTFIEFTKKLDSMRDQSFLDYSPEFSKYFS